MLEYHTCPYCGTDVKDGYTVCTGCQAEVKYGPTDEDYRDRGSTSGCVGVFLSVCLGLIIFKNEPIGLKIIFIWFFTAIIGAICALIGYYVSKPFIKQKYKDKVIFHRYSRYS